MGPGENATSTGARVDAPFILLLSLVLVALNALKPVNIDDATYLEFAQHLARHPLDPYGGMSSTAGATVGQFQILAPLVLPYWLALGIALFGDGELVLKLWLLPVAVLLVWAIWRLMRRFAPGCAWASTMLAIFSPTIVAGFNFMLDVPALALGLAALELFLAAMDRDSWKGALGAGLVAALAMQTKYSMLTIPAAMLLASIVRGRIRLGLIACMVAATAFLAWELFVYAARGDSHFRFHMLGRLSGVKRFPQPQTLYILIGEIAPALIVLALAALGASMRALLVTTAVLVALLALSVMGMRQLALPGATGVVFWLAIAWVVWRLLRSPELGTTPPHRRDTWFLVGWLLLEVAASYAIAPMPAARRLIGVLLVASLIVFRLVAAELANGQPLRAGTRVAVALAIVFGVAVQFLDVLFFADQRAAAIEAARWARLNAPQSRAWFWSTGTFSHYARQAGLTFADPPTAVLRPGDIMLDPLAPFSPPLARDTFETIAMIPVGFSLGFSSALHGGHALINRRGGVVLRIHRIVRETRVQPEP